MTASVVLAVDGDTVSQGSGYGVSLVCGSTQRDGNHIDAQGRYGQFDSSTQFLCRLSEARRHEAARDVDEHSHMSTMSLPSRMRRSSQSSLSATLCA